MGDEGLEPDRLSQGAWEAVAPSAVEEANRLVQRLLAELRDLGQDQVIVVAVVLVLLGVLVVIFIISVLKVRRSGLEVTRSLHAVEAGVVRGVQVLSEVRDRLHVVGQDLDQVRADLRFFRGVVEVVDTTGQMGPVTASAAVQMLGQDVVHAQIGEFACLLLLRKAVFLIAQPLSLVVPTAPVVTINHPSSSFTQLDGPKVEVEGPHSLRRLE
jgi:hypothetical protein